MSGQQRRQRDRPEGEQPVDVPIPPSPPRAANGASPGTPSSGSNNYRGLDSGLAKAAPSAEGLTQSGYRSYRRRLELYALQCRRRSTDAEIEGALLVISLLKDTVWDAAEQIDLKEITSGTNPFAPLFTMMDQLFQYEEQIEVPYRCEEFFQSFNRQKGEEMQAYLIRHRTALKKLREVKIDIPPLLAGWHLLTRSGTPKWTHVQVKALCKGELDYEEVQRALLRMFGGDHKPNTKDIGPVAKSSKDEFFYEEDYDEEFYYEGEEEDDWHEIYYEGDEDEEEIPEELEEAYENMDEAYISYLESRKRMKELALARGFYPVVAIGPDFDHGKGGKSERKGSSKGKGKSKGKEKEKAKEKACFLDAQCMVFESHHHRRPLPPPS